MNKSRRNRLGTALEYIEKAQSIIEDVKYEEEDSLSNMPENLEFSERYSDMENNADDLDAALSNIEEVKTEIIDVIDRGN